MSLHLTKCHIVGNHMSQLISLKERTGNMPHTEPAFVNNIVTDPPAPGGAV